MASAPAAGRSELKEHDGGLPLKDRVLKSSLSVALVPLCHRPVVYKRWTDGRMDKALDAVTNQGLSVRRAAEEFDIPKSTLHDRLSGRVLIGGRSGPPKYLTDDEEQELEEFLVGSAAVGYARSRQQVLQLAQEVVTRKGLAAHVSHGWWDSFKRRHPKLSLRTAAPVSYARLVASDSDILHNYYDLLERTLQENCLVDKPAQIFNLDETGMPLDPSPPRVVARRGQKHPSAVGSGDKTQITVLSCCSASGYALPPFVIFDRMTLKPELTDGEVPGTVYGLSKNGWIDGDLFDLWFARHFLSHAPPVRPLLLLVDGHSSHFQPSVIQRAAKEGVIMFCLPPHTTHLTQPLDKGCFGPLKSHWREVCWQYITVNPGRIITRYQFSKLFALAWFKGMTMQNIIGGFRVTGVYPFDRAVVLPKESRLASLAERTGLKFIPLCSPSRRKLDKAVAAAPHFLPEEIARFQIRYEEGYDLPDDRYRQWVRMYHPESLCDHGLISPVSEAHLVLQPEEGEKTCILPHSSVLSSLLSENVPQIKHPSSEHKSSGRVLTSSENLLKLEEKRREKEAIAEEKQRKKEEREKKRLANEKEKQRKAIERKRKQEEKLRLNSTRRRTESTRKGTLTQVMQRRGNRKEGVPSGDDCETGFSAEEVARFRVRLQEGYDLPDQRYSQWVRMYHPECEGVSELPRGGHEVTGAALSADTDPGTGDVGRSRGPSPHSFTRVLRSGRTTHT